MFELHPASVLGGLLGGGTGDPGPAAREAEPEADVLAPGRLASLHAALRRRRETAKPAVAAGR